MVTFQPGKFSPVVEVSQRSSGLPAPADTDFAGLEEVSSATLLLSRAASRGTGAIVDDPTPTSRIALIIGSLLAARNIVEQLNFLGVFTRVSGVLRSARGQFLEPFVRAYNFYGHFELEGKTYVTRGLEEQYIRYLFNLRKYATRGVAEGTKYVETGGDLRAIDLQLYRLSKTGDVVFSRMKPLKAYLLDLVQTIINADMTVDSKVPFITDCLDVSSEDALAHFIRRVRFLIPEMPIPDRETLPAPSDDHKKAMKKLFNAEYSSDGDVVPNALFVSGVNEAYSLLRRISLELSSRMKTIDFPKYEGGSASQLAELVDDTLFSSVSLSLVDSTAALAFTTCYGTSARFKSAPGITREELLRELVAQSIITI